MKTILFVDDTSQILKVYQKLFEKEHDFRCFYVEDAESALSYLSTIAIDILVTDIEMPIIDGKVLLSLVKDTYPCIVRIIISGAILNNKNFEYVKLAHRFFRKPTNLKTILSAIHHTVFVQTFILGTRARKILGDIDTIPTYPHIMQKIETEMAAKNGSLAKIGKIISEDPSLTSSILKLINSEYFAVKQEVLSTEHAVALIGLEGVKGLITSHFVVKEIPEDLYKAFDVEHLLKHSLVTAQYAKEIALYENWPQSTIEIMFVAGLLHDIGRLVLEINFAEIEFEIKGYLLGANDTGELAVLEKSNIGVSHAQAGAYLLGLWGIKDEVIEAIALHHNPSKYKLFNYPELVAVIHCADQFAYENFPKSQFDGIEKLDREFLDLYVSEEQLLAWRNLCNELIH